MPVQAGYKGKARERRTCKDALRESAAAEAAGFYRLGDAALDICRRSRAKSTDAAGTAVCGPLAGNAGKECGAVFYGPMLLAFETRDEVILKGNKDEILAGLSFADSESGRFVLKNGEREFRLRPLFDVDKESYGVYATIRNY